MVASAFDALALRYDELWTQSVIGQLQRQAVWRRLDALFRPGDVLLDLGCGSGEDAVHFMRSRMRVRAIDASNAMVRIACSRGVDATRLAIEELGRLQGSFDGVLSNFGALNCVRRLDLIRGPLARLVRPGGHLAICIMGCFCLWETAWYLLHARPGKAFRRWRQHGASSSLGIRIYYPSVRQVQQAFLPDFSLVDWCGVGISIPPSYVSGLSERVLSRLAAFESFVAHRPAWRSMADHRLLIFARK
jgi:ubiquinone/menaquinone biosynthesis C-methylase UbiE